MPGLLVNPFISFGGGGAPADPSGWTQISQISPPVSGAFSFTGLDLSAYDRVELWLQGVKTGTASTKVNCRLRYAGPTTGTHAFSIRNRTSADSSFSDVQGTAQTEGRIAGNNGSTYAFQNGSADSLAGVISIDNPSGSLKKIVEWKGAHCNGGGNEYMRLDAVNTITETGAIIEIIILGSNNLTAGVATLMGLVN